MGTSLFQSTTGSGMQACVGGGTETASSTEAFLINWVYSEGLLP